MYKKTTQQLLDLYPECVIDLKYILHCFVLSGGSSVAARGCIGQLENADMWLKLLNFKNGTDPLDYGNYVTMLYVTYKSMMDKQNRDLCIDLFREAFELLAPHILKNLTDKS